MKRKKRERLLKVLTDITNFAEIQICPHDETHRGGAIWEICDSCGASWADDEGGKPEFVEAPAISEARKYIQELMDDKNRKGL